MNQSNKSFLESKSAYCTSWSSDGPLKKSDGISGTSGTTCTCGLWPLLSSFPSLCCEGFDDGVVFLNFVAVPFLEFMTNLEHESNLCLQHESEPLQPKKSQAQSLTPVARNLPPNPEKPRGKPLLLDVSQVSRLNILWTFCVGAEKHAPMKSITEMKTALIVQVSECDCGAQMWYMSLYIFHE